MSLVTVYPKLSACGSRQEVLGETWQSFEPFCSLKWCSNYKRKLPFLRGNKLTRSPDWISCQTMTIRWFLQFIYWWFLHQRYEQKDYNLLGSNAEVAGKNLLTSRVNTKIEAVHPSETLANLYHTIPYHSHQDPYDRLTLEPQTP